MLLSVSYLGFCINDCEGSRESRWFETYMLGRKLKALILFNQVVDDIWDH